MTLMCPLCWWCGGEDGWLVVPYEPIMDINAAVGEGRAWWGGGGWNGSKWRQGCRVWGEKVGVLSDFWVDRVGSTCQVSRSFSDWTPSFRI